MRRITLIIPLRLTPATHEGAERLRRICATVPRDLYEILVSDYGTQGEGQALLAELEAEGIRVVRHPSPGKLFSIGQSRDFGVVMAREGVVMFNDIDFLATPEMYRRIHAEAQARDLWRNLFDFFCVPVLFLTEAGTKSWFADTGAGRPFLETATVEEVERRSDAIQFTAFGSSAMVINRHHYLALGGHDARFRGHGAEDYDLLHRLGTLAPKGPRPREYFTDFKDNGVRSYWGFRAWFALNGLDLFRAGIHLVHLWHPRRMEKGYFRSRPNFRHLRRLMRRFERNGAMPLPLAGGGGEARWLVLYGTAEDVALARQLVPFARAVDFLRLGLAVRTGRIRQRIAELEPDLVLVMPAAMRHFKRIRTALESLGVPVVTCVEGEGADTFTFFRHGEGRHPVAARALPIRSQKGALLYRWWPDLALEGLLRVESGAIPPPRTLADPLFESFGGKTALDRRLHPRPKRRKKSSLWVRFKRWVTGY